MLKTTMQKIQAKNKRFWEIDFLRGIAVIMMIVYHFVLNYSWIFGSVPYEYSWLIFARATAVIFILLVGISLTLSYSAAKKNPKYKAEMKMFMKYLTRGLKIFGLGMLVTLASLLYLRSGFIMFGILHFIGIAIILAYPFLKLNRSNFINLFFAAVFAIIGFHLSEINFDLPWLMAFGLRPARLFTYDYFPIFPWFGAVLLGLFFGRLLYTDGKRDKKLKYMRWFEKTKLASFLPMRLLCFIGRHSLVIYFLHAPILIGILYFLRL